MGRVGEVLTVDGGEVKCDEEDPCTPEHYQPPGYDGLPLAGDFAAIEDSSGEGAEQAVAYHDPSDGNRKAEPGEARLYGRSPAGVLVGEVWLKGDGTLLFKSLLTPVGASIELKPDGKIAIGNLIEIDTLTGIIKCTDVAFGPPTPKVSLATHVHATAALGAPSPPISPPPPP